MSQDAVMLTPQEVSQILGVHQKTVHQWLRSGKLGGIKISYRAWRIPKASLAQFLEKNKNQCGNTAATNVSDHNCVSEQQPEESSMKQYIQVILGENKKSRHPKDDHE